MAFKTGWVRIATSGKTVDGRVIAPNHLTEMAEQYDPEEYEAAIWYEHKDYYGNFGRVLDLDARPDNKGRVQLYAVLEPSSNLIYVNRSGQKLHSSIEYLPDFANTGKAYLVGLAVTDRPASIGTSRLQFSVGKIRGEATLCTDCIEIDSCAFDSDPSSNQQINLIRKMLSSIGLEGLLSGHSLPKPDPSKSPLTFDPTTHDMNPMGKKPIITIESLSEQMTRFIEENNSRLDKLEKRIHDSDDPGAEPKEEPEKFNDTDVNVQLKSLGEKVDASSKSIERLASALAKNLKEMPGTDGGPHDGGGDDEAEVF